MFQFVTLRPVTYILIEKQNTFTFMISYISIELL